MTRAKGQYILGLGIAYIAVRILCICRRVPVIPSLYYSLHAAVLRYNTALSLLPLHRWPTSAEQHWFLYVLVHT